jgi:nucleoside-diphosphate-sugar epimerase
MRILVTGANGFVGKNLCEYLKNRRFLVFKTDLHSAEFSGDVADEDFVFNSFKDLELDAIVHLAAMANIEETIKKPHQCYKVNCFGTSNMLELARRKSVKRFIYMSSANVYGIPSKLPVTEETPLNPRTPYDYSKVIAEMLVESYHVHQKLPTVILRCWKLFGKYDVETTAMTRFIKACLQNRPIPLYNAGRDATDPTYIENFCYAAELSLKKDEAIGEAFNVGCGDKVSIKHLAEKIKKLTISESKLQLLPPRTELEATPMISYPSIKKIREKLGYKPVISLEEGLRRTIEHFKTA